MRQIAKSQTRHCFLARCMWSKLHTEQTNVSDDGHSTDTLFQDPNCETARVTGWVRALAS